MPDMNTPPAWWPDACSDPRIAPHLQSLADLTFAAMMRTAVEQKIIDAGNLYSPFDVQDEHVGNLFKACIASFLNPLSPK